METRFMVNMHNKNRERAREREQVLLHTTVAEQTTWNTILNYFSLICFIFVFKLFQVMATKESSISQLSTVSTFLSCMLSNRGWTIWSPASLVSLLWLLVVETDNVSVRLGEEGSSTCCFRTVKSEGDK